MQKAGFISNLQRQVKFELQPEFYFNGKKERATYYIADFTYIDEHGDMIVEDVKGVKTQMYKDKKKRMKYIYGIEIKET